MMVQGKFEIWVLPNNLRASSERAANILKNSKYDALFLDVRRELNDLVEDLALGAPYEHFIDEVRRSNILREPISSWEHQFKPIFLALRGLKIRRPSVKIFCYRSARSEDSLIKRAEKIALLILRINSTGKVDVKEWRETIYGSVSESALHINEETDYILRVYHEENLRGKFTIVISNFSGRNILKRLKDAGINASLRYMLLPYYFTPLETLIREAAVMLRKGLNISDERIIYLAKMHADFIRNYILTSCDYDEAYFRWVKDKVTGPNNIAFSSHIF
ncbi:MAG: hypothetical protein QXM44_03340 [Candidatus Bathyarchaeia archaeon]